jgi:hypothetical protein
MKQLRVAVAANKKASSDKKKQGIVKAARVEEKLDAEDRANDQHGNNPPPTTTKKVLRPRPEPETVEMDTGMFDTSLGMILTFSGRERREYHHPCLCGSPQQ